MTASVTSLPPAEQWHAYGYACGFVGNELLMPMNRSKNFQGIDPEFWKQMPLPDNETGRLGLNRLTAYTQAAAAKNNDSSTVDPGMLAASVEFAHLFIGPPKPAAAPWETANDPFNADKVGYGRATVAMKKLLAEEGLELGGSNRQFEDHLGIELLYLSALCNKVAQGLDTEYEQDTAAEQAALDTAHKAARFVNEHPLSWIEHLRTSVDAERPHGYYSALLQYIQGVLEDFSLSLRDKRSA